MLLAKCPNGPDNEYKFERSWHEQSRLVLFPRRPTHEGLFGLWVNYAYAKPYFRRRSSR
jgi:hypothetical protein